MVNVVVGEEDVITSVKSVKQFCEVNKFDLQVIPGEPHKLWGFTELPDLVLKTAKDTLS